MRVRVDTDLNEVVDLVRRQARLARVLGLTDAACMSAEDEAEAADSSRRAANVERWRALTDRLEPLLELDYGDCRRCNVIVFNGVFPPEWRCAAVSTLLPRDVATWLPRWQRWYERGRAGHLKHYLTRLWAWEKAREVSECQAALLAQAARGRRRQNDSITEAEFCAMRDRVLRLPPSPRVPAPGSPPSSAHDDRPTADQARYVAHLMDHVTLIRTTAIEYNRTASRGSRAYVDIRPETPEEHSQSADSWLEAFFAWAEPIVRTHRGLYLWG